MNTERSPIRHFTSVTFDPETGIWTRPKDKADGTMYAAMFCEAVFLLKLSGVLEPKKSRIDLSKIRIVNDDDLT